MGSQYAPEGAAPIGEPLLALLRVAGEIAAFKDFIGARVAELRAEEWRCSGATSEQVRAEIGLYERALDRTAKVLTDISRLGLEARQVAIYEQQAAMLVGLLERVFDRLELSESQRELAPAVVVDELGRVMSAGG